MDVLVGYSDPIKPSGIRLLLNE